jgi:hypothetical protein
MTIKGEFATRIEQYHGAFPMGVYLVMFLSATKDNNIRLMEKDLFRELVKLGGKRIRFETRLKPAERFYCDFNQLSTAFRNIRDKHPGSVLDQYHLGKINKQGEKNMNSKKEKYVGKITYFI